MELMNWNLCHEMPSNLGCIFVVPQEKELKGRGGRLSWGLHNFQGFVSPPVSRVKIRTLVSPLLGQFLYLSCNPGAELGVEGATEGKMGIAKFSFCSAPSLSALRESREQT